jgi:DinB superfamily
METLMTHRLHRRILVIFALVAVSACAAAPADDVPEDAAAGSTLRLQDLRKTVVKLQDKFHQLAEAMPEDTYDWRPMEGVRSVGDVYKHISADNFFVPALMDFEAPAQTGITKDGDTFDVYADREATKEEIVAGVDQSFDFFLASMDASAGDLSREMTLGQPTTVGDVWIRAVVHLHEHLGQSIAYARSNRVVPPWSM